MSDIIGSAGSKLNLRLSQTPQLKDPMLNIEFQDIHNALNLLGNYMDVLRENLESAPGQVPSESIRFRRAFWATAEQKITTGSVVSPNPGGGIINGVLSSDPPVGNYSNSADSVGATGTRAMFQVSQRFFGIALTDAEIGELVRVGIGPGVLQLTGAKSGQLVWGVDSRSIYTARNAGDFLEFYLGFRFPAENGGLYLNNVVTTHVFQSGGGYNWEGYWMPGFPRNSGGQYQFNRVFLYPIGVCITDNYVLFSDYKRSDPLPYAFI